LALCEWNAKLDKAMLGARIVKSIQKGWNEVLEYARVLDPDFKPASSPDEEMTRNDKLLAVLAKLKAELPEVEKSLTSLSSKLGSAIPKDLTETLARLNGLVTVGSYQEFDAAVRESYANKDAFAAAFAEYENARTLRDQAFQISQAFDYLSGACEVDSMVELNRTSLLTMLSLDSYLKQPSLIVVHMDGFQKWKINSLLSKLAV
jgi:benzoyl-CoA reductase/2-hydroxyglutaryl-CoA dehydratase subunit BcrC/BadD/HgdB